MDVRAYTVGPFQENTYVLRADGSDRAIVIDPGDNGEQLLDAIEKLGATVEAILITHTDVDHVGAVAPLAKATGAPVYCPKLEVDRLADIMGHVPIEGIGPYEGYDAGGDRRGRRELELAGLRIEVVATPGHTEGHVTYVFPDEGVDRLGRRAVPELRRTDRPPQRRPPDAARLDRDAARPLPRRHARPARATWAPPPSAGRRRRTPSWPSSRSERPDPGAARHVRRAARGLARAPEHRGRRPAHPRGRRLPAHRDADLRGDRAVRPRRRRVDRHRPEGDVHLRGRRRPVADAAARRAPRRSRARTSSTACTRRRSR